MKFTRLANTNVKSRKKEFNMKVIAIITVAIFAFLIIPVHYLVIVKFTHAVDYPKTPLILLVVLAFLIAIFTAGYNESKE